MSKKLKRIQVAGGVDMTAVVGLVSDLRGSGRRSRKSGASVPSFVAAVGLLLLALPSSQPAHALDAISIAGVNKAFETAAPAATKTSMRGDTAVAALREFVQGLSSSQATDASADKADDYMDLRAYSAGLGADRATAPKSDEIKSDEIQLAQAAAPKAKTPVKVTKAAPSGDAYNVGSAKCATCHANQVAEFNKTLMGRLNLTTRKGQFECENCHGPGSAHVAAGGGRGVGGMNGFHPTTPEQVEQDNAICLGCHEKGKRTAWAGSTHEERGLACSTCHSVMRNVGPKFNLAKLTTEEVCFQCHKLQRAQMQRSSHMPVREGKITCSNCHNPHGSVYGTEAMLDAPSINDNCYKCHAEKRGPMMFEHAPVRENCLNCHEAHGSNHEALLKVQRPRLCAECHAFAHGGQGGMGAGTGTSNTVAHSCNNCHSQIHGSNSPSGAFFQR
jgi:DmsE family decaheme c-type cytochrome